MEYIGISEPDHPIAFRFEETGPIPIGVGRECMAVPINLDDQTRRLTNEVDSVAADALLPPKFPAAKPASPQHGPKPLFSGRRIAPQSPGAVDRSVIVDEAALRHTLTLPSLRDGPLPLPQGERVSGKRDVRGVFLLHADGVIARVDMMRFAGDAAREIAEQIER